MRLVDYQKGLKVSKAIAGSSDLGRRIVSTIKVGVTLSDEPFKVAGSGAWYALVQWHYASKPEQVALNVLVHQPEMAEVTR